MSLFNPPGNTSSNITVFKDLIIWQLMWASSKSQPHREVQNGINSLCDRKNSVIRPVDKGVGIVLLNKEDYLEQINNNFLDTYTYEVLRKEPTCLYKKNSGRNIETL